MGYGLVVCILSNIVIGLVVVLNVEVVMLIIDELVKNYKEKLRIDLFFYEEMLKKFVENYGF